MYLMFNKIIIRTFLGIGDLFEGEFFKELSEWALKEVEWAIIITAVIGVGIQKNIITVIILGMLLMVFFLGYCITTVNDKLFFAFKKDVRRANERNYKNKLPAYSDLSTTICFLAIMIILNLLMILALYYGVLAFEML